MSSARESKNGGNPFMPVLKQKRMIEEQTKMKVPIKTGPRSHILKIADKLKEKISKTNSGRFGFWAHQFVPV